jgi:hypothetical protein
VLRPDGLGRADGGCKATVVASAQIREWANHMGAKPFSTFLARDEGGELALTRRQRHRLVVNPEAIHLDRPPALG